MHRAAILDQDSQRSVVRVGRRHGRRPSGLARSISHAGLDRVRPYRQHRRRRLLRRHATGSRRAAGCSSVAALVGSRGHDVLLGSLAATSSVVVPDVGRCASSAGRPRPRWPTPDAARNHHDGECAGPRRNSVDGDCRRASVVVIPSRYEVSPILLAEAWAAGNTVVATDAGGLAALAPGRARVVLPDDPEGSRVR